MKDHLLKELIEKLKMTKLNQLIAILTKELNIETETETEIETEID